MSDLFEGADVIFSYSRAQAIADGVLIDISEIAREAGFKVPVAITRAAWADCVEWSEATQQRKRTVQDESGRLWDVVYMANFEARRNAGHSRVTFTVYRVPTEGRGIVPKPATLVVHVGPGDQGEPVITIMQPGED